VELRLNESIFIFDYTGGTFSRDWFGQSHCMAAGVHALLGNVVFEADIN
jgi:hypothetical protein